METQKRTQKAKAPKVTRLNNLNSQTDFVIRAIAFPNPKGRNLNTKLKSLNTT